MALGRWAAGTALFFATTLAWITGAIIVGIVALSFLAAGMGGRTRIPINGPAGDKHPAFVEMTERTMEFKISDRPWTWNPISLGTLNPEDPRELEDFCWSADGSVIARASRTHSPEPAFYVAYDFREHQLIGPQGVQNLESSAIATLLSQRGGQGPFLGKIESSGEAPLPIASWLLPGGILLAGASISWGLIGGKGGRPRN